MSGGVTEVRANAEREPVDNLPDWELVFRFASGRLCLSFCATVGERWRRGFERLREPGDLGRWLAAAGLATEPVPVTPDQLEQARRLREAVYRLVRAGMAGTAGLEADRSIVNAYARRRPVAPQISRQGQPEVWGGPAVVSAGLASIARDAVDLLTSEARERVRECGAPDCALLFVDTSRPGRRRWCTGGACGAKSRSSAYRARRTAGAGQRANQLSG